MRPTWFKISLTILFSPTDVVYEHNQRQRTPQQVKAGRQGYQHGRLHLRDYGILLLPPVAQEE